jgi:GTPase SAR1 family protein
LNEGQTRVRLQLWDTAGSEKYHSMTFNHYRNAVGAFLVYDITNEESFNNLSFWLDELKERLDPYAMIGLFANKVDIMFSQPEKREILREQAIQFARDNQLFFLDECSALADIMVKDTILGLINGIYCINRSLIEKGIKTENELKCIDEDHSLNFKDRCCY